MKRDVCVDLDGVLAKYDGWRGIENIGEPIEGAREFLTALRKDYNVVIFTTRCNPEINGRNGEGANLLAKRVEEWLTKNEMPFDHVYRGVGKPICMAFFDDNAFRLEPQATDDSLGAYSDALFFLDAANKRARERAEARKKA